MPSNCESNPAFRVRSGTVVSKSMANGRACQKSRNLVQREIKGVQAADFSRENGSAAIGTNGELDRVAAGRRRAWDVLVNAVLFLNELAVFPGQIPGATHAGSAGAHF